MKFATKFRILLYKNYLDKGLGLTYYLKYLILLFGFTTQNLDYTLLIAGFYVVASFFIGWLWFRYNWVVAENEINNRYNLFVRQMRREAERFKYKRY